MKFNELYTFEPAKMFLDKTNMAQYVFGRIHFNKLIGYYIKIKFVEVGLCLHCKKKLKTRFRDQGLCIRCYMKMPYTDICMFFPEKCHFHLGTCRDPVWGIKNCFQPHYLYLAFSHDFKIGVTRFSNVPRRFIQQGAELVIPLVQTSKRLVAGYLESYLKNHISHTTSWLKMLKCNNLLPPESLHQKKDEIIHLIKDLIDEYKDDTKLLNDHGVLKIVYPYAEPIIAKSLNLEKMKEIEGKLLGIKGQYFILNTGLLKFDKLEGLVCIVQIST